MITVPLMAPALAQVAPAGLLISSVWKWPPPAPVLLLLNEIVCNDAPLSTVRCVPAALKLPAVWTAKFPCTRSTPAVSKVSRPDPDPLKRATPPTSTESAALRITRKPWLGNDRLSVVVNVNPEMTRAAPEPLTTTRPVTCSVSASVSAPAMNRFDARLRGSLRRGFGVPVSCVLVTCHAVPTESSRSPDSVIVRPLPVTEPAPGCTTMAPLTATSVAQTIPAGFLISSVLKCPPLTPGPLALKLTVCAEAPSSTVRCVPAALKLLAVCTVKLPCTRSTPAVSVVSELDPEPLNRATPPTSTESAGLRITRKPWLGSDRLSVVVSVNPAMTRAAPDPLMSTRPVTCSVSASVSSPVTSRFVARLRGGLGLPLSVVLVTCHAVPMESSRLPPSVTVRADPTTLPEPAWMIVGPAIAASEASAMPAGFFTSSVPKCEEPRASPGADNETFWLVDPTSTVRCPAEGWKFEANCTVKLPCTRSTPAVSAVVEELPSKNALPPI